MPIKGAPIEFRKVYFQGVPKDKDGKDLNCTLGAGITHSKNYYSHFLCSNPIKQYECIEGGISYNPRNEYINLLDGEVSDWKDFDIGASGPDKTDLSLITTGCTYKKYHRKFFWSIFIIPPTSWAAKNLM